VHGIEGQQVGGVGGIAGRIVHIHQLDSWSPPEGAEHQAAHAAEAVDADLQGTGLQLTPRLASSAID
jgi:hypothetical protein